MTYTVQFWSSFNQKWQDYAAITHNAKPVRHADEQKAQAYLEQLKRDHPGDKFRVVEVA